MSDATCPLCGAACTRITVLGISMFGCRCTGDRGYAISLDERIDSVVADIEQLQPPFVQKFPLAKMSWEPVVPVGEFDAAAESYASMRKEATEMFMQLFKQQGVTAAATKSSSSDDPLYLRRGIESDRLAMKANKVAMAQDFPLAMPPSAFAGVHRSATTESLQHVAPINPTTYRHLMDEFQCRYDAHTHTTSAPSSVAHIALEERVNPDIDEPPASCEGCNAQVANIDLLDCTMRCTACRARVGLPPIGAATASPDPLDAVIDGVTLRDLLNVDAWARAEASSEARYDRQRWTPAQRAAVSTHWAAELRAKVEAGKRADRERVVLDCAEEL